MANWHARCSIAGLLPKEFELLPRNEEKENSPETKVKPENDDKTTLDMTVYNNEKKIEDKREIILDESIYNNEIKIEDKKSFMEPDAPTQKKKSFHSRRKEELKKKALSKQFVVTITEKENKEKKEKKRKKENHVFNCFKFGPPNIIKITLGIFLACALIPLSATNSTDPNGYRPSATRTDFRDVQHNPKLIDHIRDLNYINTTISTVHADHIGVQTFVHEVKYIIEDVEYGVDQSCQAIIGLSDECHEEESSCQYVNEGIATNERVIRKYVQILNVFQRVCTLEDVSASKIIISRCKHGEHWKLFNPIYEVYGFLNEAKPKHSEFDHEMDKRVIFTMTIVAISTIVRSLAVAE